MSERFVVLPPACNFWRVQDTSEHRMRTLMSNVYMIYAYHYEYLGYITCVMSTDHYFCFPRPFRGLTCRDNFTELQVRAGHQTEAL